MIINPYVYTRPLVPGAAAVFSLRSVPGYLGGNVVRVRRGSDNDEQDFTATKLVDGTLAAFCGASHGFVPAWYDQSGNGRHTGQITQSCQPKIYDSVSGGVTQNGRPAISFDGVDDFLNGGDILDLGLNSLSFFAVFSHANLTVYPTLLGKGRTGSGIGRWSYHLESSTNPNRFQLFFVRSDSTHFKAIQGSISTVNTTYLDSGFIVRNDGLYVYRNGLLGGTNGASKDTATNYDATNHFYIGVYQDTSGVAPLAASYLNGKVSEIVVYSSNQLSNRTEIEAGINTYYAIY